MRISQKSIDLVDAAFALDNQLNPAGILPITIAIGKRIIYVYIIGPVENIPGLAIPRKFHTFPVITKEL